MVRLTLGVIICMVLFASMGMTIAGYEPQNAIRSVFIASLVALFVMLVSMWRQQKNEDEKLVSTAHSGARRRAS